MKIPSLQDLKQVWDRGRERERLQDGCSPRPSPNIWRSIAWVSGVFCALVAATLLLTHLATTPQQPLNSPQLKTYKSQLRDLPNDESLKQRVRGLDLQLRRRYFGQLSQTRVGTYFLLAGAAIFVLAFSRTSRKQLPMPRLNPAAAEQEAQASHAARWSTVLSSAAAALLLLALGLLPSTGLPRGPADVEGLLMGGANEVSSDAVSVAELKQNWPRFRGPEGNGVSSWTNLPASWDAKSGAGIAWKVPASGRGFNSPITWNDRVFLSSGDASRREVFALDANTGRELWRQIVTVTPSGSAAEVPDSSGHAAATMATDGRRVYAFFGNGDLAAFAFDGKPVWSRSFGPLRNGYGHAASLVSSGNRLLLQLDQGEPEQGKSRLYALEGRTGKTLWERPRQAGSSWATPLVIEAAGKTQVITLAVPRVISYDANNGSELWRVEGLNGEITPSPIFTGGLLFVISPSEKLFAIRPDGLGDVTKSHVVWTTEENVPDVTSPTSNGELLFTLTTTGILTCFDAKDGKKRWDHDLETEFHASPSLAGNRLYLFGQKGLAVVVDAAPQFKELFRTTLEDEFHASPAFLSGRIILRGTTNIWCLGATTAVTGVAKGN